MENNLKIGFVGLGLMGNAMAKNLIKKGFEVYVYNRSPEKLSDFKKLNAKIFSSPGELAKNCDVVISMVTGPKDVEEVMLGEEGVVKSKKKGLIAVDMSTIGPKAARDIGEKLKKQGIIFLDAPVTGGLKGAIEGNLTIFVGGDKKVYEKLKDVFLAMGKNLEYMGQMGNGQAIKLVNNYMLAAGLTILSEGLLLGECLGLPKKKTSEVLADSTMTLSPHMKLKMENLVNDIHKTTFTVKNMHKDVRLALDETVEGKINLPALKLVERLYQKGTNSDVELLDVSAVFRIIEKNQKES